MTDTANGATMMPDELRDAIDEYCARDPADIFREALEHTIEERNTLIDMYNALKAENDRLRALLQDVAICASGNYCYDCPHQHDGCDRDERLRAEGIEVQ